MIRNSYRGGIIGNVGGGTVWPFALRYYLLMNRKDELCEETEEVKFEGKGVVSSCDDECQKEVERAKDEPPEEGV